MEPDETIEISTQHYEELLADREFLEALRHAGVDNWDGYDYALEILNGEDLNA